ncbi:uncharacterized protein LOC133420748 [Cololabis saira]|uniref:uncharacterized protein LOC133420748 n=1 Tax=Cololabis saira TaxID=129043 RepID=UPI002AD3AC1C|nr:uncharacterized protein LOC133420748 [Cololabis saira]
MWSNSPSANNDSVFHPDLSASNSFLSLYLLCLSSKPSSIVLLFFNATNAFLHLTFSTFIIHHGLQQWWQKQPSSSRAAMSHSDCFSYNLATMELISVIGCFITCCVNYWEDREVMSVVSYTTLCFIWFGEMLFHLLTCIERYLAVVHPITYLSLRNKRGIRIRNISIGCVWLFSAVGTSFFFVNFFIITSVCVLIFAVTMVSFCSLSVLRVLIRPGPGEQVGDKKRGNKSKKRAFYTILAILGVLLMRSAWSLGWAVLYVARGTADCVLMTVDLWLNLPGSMVLPLVFLLRSGKCAGCKKTIHEYWNWFYMKFT